MQNGDSDQPERPEPRKIGEIFDDLRVLAQSDGAIHSISKLFYRDCVLAIDVHEGKILDDAEKRWSISKLNNNELMLLLGLTIQSDSDQTFSVLPKDDEFLTTADKLLREFHDRMIENARAKMDWSDPDFVKKDEVLGPLSQEAIYYGADGFYLHQFERLARHRYREDGEWLLGNIGVSIRPMLKIARFIVDKLTHQITATTHIAKETGEVGVSDLSDSLLIEKSSLIKKFGLKAEAFISKFSLPATGSNTDFLNPFDINQVNFLPLIDIGKFLYVSNQYRLLAAIYESPIYWMLNDKNYQDTAAKHRGDFLEDSATHQLRSVFGKDNVFKNVTIRRNRKEIAGEADVLVTYGEFVIVVQAKSKRVTQEARAGNIDALKADFESAIQTPYRQAYEFSELIQGGAECELANGEVRTFPPTVRVFPLVLLSDQFPAVTLLSSFMLERKVGIAPVIWDLGVLDTVVAILPTPIEFLFYLKSRADTFETIHSDSEFNILGYHLLQKLVLPADVDWMMIDRGLAGTIDEFMVMRDVKVDAARPLGILERISIPVISDLLMALKTAPPDLASVVIDLYDFSSAMLEELSNTILAIRREVSEGKAFKSFSVLTDSGGLTYLVCNHVDGKVRVAAEAIGKKHKYDNKCDRWYVVIDSIETKLPIDALLPVLGKWEEDEELAAMSDRVGSMFGSRRHDFVVGENSKKTGQDQDSEEDE